MSDRDSWRLELLLALVVGGIAAVALVSCPRPIRGQVALIGQCPPPDSAYRVIRVERQTSLPVDPLESLQVTFGANHVVFVYGGEQVPFIQALMREQFDIRIVRGEE